MELPWRVIPGLIGVCFIMTVHDCT